MAQFLQLDPDGLNGSNVNSGTMINVDYVNGHAFYGDPGDLQVVHVPLRCNPKNFAYLEYSSDMAAAAALKAINNAIFRDNPSGMVTNIPGAVGSIEYTEA